MVLPCVAATPVATSPIIDSTVAFKAAIFALA